MPTTKLEKITGVPAHTHAVARCFGANGRPRYSGVYAHDGHGVTWKHASGASLNNLRCPVDGGPLYQTTRSWNCNEWTVIPADVVRKAANSKRAEKAVKIQSLLDAGTHKYVRDLQPGDVFVKFSGAKNLPSGKVVAIEKIGSKYRIEVSRTREAIVKGFLYHGNWKTDDINDRANQLEQLTETVEVAGTGLVVIDPVLFRWVSFAQPGFTGFASDDPAGTLAELWTNEVERWTRVLEDKTYATPVPPLHNYESQEQYEARVLAGAKQAGVNKALAEENLRIATERLARTTQ